MCRCSIRMAVTSVDSSWSTAASHSARRWPNDDEFRRASIDAVLIVDNFGVVPAVTGDGVGRQMAMYSEAVGKVGIGGHALAGAPNGG
jgi:hypothetical protein